MPAPHAPAKPKPSHAKKRVRPALAAAPRVPSPSGTLLRHIATTWKIVGLMTVVFAGWRSLAQNPRGIPVIAIFLGAWCGSWLIKKRISPSMASTAFCVSAGGILGLLLLVLGSPELSNLGRRLVVAYGAFVLNLVVLDFVFQRVLRTRLPVWFQGFPYVSAAWCSLVPLWPNLAPAFGFALGYDFVVGACVSRRAAPSGRRTWLWYGLAGLCIPVGAGVAWAAWGPPLALAAHAS